MSNPGDISDDHGRRAGAGRPQTGSGTGTVRQNFPHGRSKAVVVEIKPAKRGGHPPGGPAAPQGARPAGGAGAARPPESRLPESRLPESRLPESRLPDSRSRETRAPDSRPAESRRSDARPGSERAGAPASPPHRPAPPRPDAPRASAAIPPLHRPEIIIPEPEKPVAAAPEAIASPPVVEIEAEPEILATAPPAPTEAPRAPAALRPSLRPLVPEAGGEPRPPRSEAPREMRGSDNAGSGSIAPNRGPRPDGNFSRGPRPDTGRPDTGRPDTGRPDTGRPEGGFNRGPRPDSAGRAPAAGGRTLSPEELAARQRALSNQDSSDLQRREQRRAADEAHLRREQAAARQRLAEDEARRNIEAEALAKQEVETRRRRDEEAKARRGEAGGAEVKRILSPVLRAAVQDIDDEGESAAGAGGRIKKAKTFPGAGAGAALKGPISRTKGEPKRRDGRLTVVDAVAEGDDRWRSLASLRRAREREKEKRMRQLGGPDAQKVLREVVVPEIITVGELANRMAERAADVIKYLMKQGNMATTNTALDADTAELIVADFGHSVKRVADSDVEEGLIGAPDDEESLTPRPPVVTIMGHVDHGKTSLLDALRHTDVAAGEAGGITQHIGAYQVQLKNDARITFLDTPGHAAFSGMRARGAQVTDIVILVVAADDGVMPQTIEAISHSKAAGVPMIVAVNKIDKPDANPAKVLQELVRHEVIPESLGGDVQVVEVSALKKLGLDDLTDAILLQAEVLALTANPDRAAEGVVIEAQLDQGRGAVATVLVQRGSLKRGDIIVAGMQWGRVRALVNERKQQLKDAGPTTPVEVLGLDGAPEPGDQVVVVENESRAREIVDYRQRLRREKSGAVPMARSSLEQLMARMKQSDVKELPVVVKADVQGSSEAIVGALEKLGATEVRARVIYSGVGGVSESDVLLAKSSGAPIVAFNVRANKQARDLADQEGVEIRYYSIIYNLLDDIKGVLSGMLAPERRETFIGYAQILEVFNITKVGKVAGCRISEGTVKRGCGVRLLRENVVIHEGKLSTLKRFKDEVPEVTGGQECGMAFENYQDVRVGDQIECFTVEIVERKLA